MCNALICPTVISWMKRDQILMTKTWRLSARNHTVLSTLQLVCVGQLRLFAPIPIYFSRLFHCKCTIARRIKTHCLLLLESASQLSALQKKHSRRAPWTWQKSSSNSTTRVLFLIFWLPLLCWAPMDSAYSLIQPPDYTCVVQWTGY